MCWNVTEIYIRTSLNNLQHSLHISSGHHPKYYEDIFVPTTRTSFHLLRGCSSDNYEDVVPTTSRMQFQRHRGTSQDFIPMFFFANIQKTSKNSKLFALKYAISINNNSFFLQYYIDYLHYYNNSWQFMTILKELQCH